MFSIRAKKPKGVTLKGYKVQSISDSDRKTIVNLLNRMKGELNAVKTLEGKPRLYAMRRALNATEALQNQVNKVFTLNPKPF
jgi:hypothetical protein